MKKTIFKYSVLLFVFVTGLLFISGCENPFTGYGPQPSFLDDTESLPKMNVFGVLRPDKYNGKPFSYVHLEGIFSVTSEYPDSFDITDAEVTLFQYEGESVINSINLNYTDFNSAFTEKQYRAPDYFPEAENTYGLSCRKAGFPELTAKTVIPSVPEIINDEITVTPGKISFHIRRDSLAALYDVIMTGGPDKYMTRIFRPEEGNIKVDMNINSGSGIERKLYIYAYDLNLSEYITGTIIIKPNTYFPSNSKVTNGYGCFGSLNVLERIVTF